MEMDRFTLYGTEVSTVVTVQIIRGKGGIKKSNAVLRGVEGDKREPGAWGRNWAIPTLGEVSTETGPLSLTARLRNWPCKKLLLQNANKRKPDGLIEMSLAESSEESYGSKRGVLSMLMTK
jgi:hypothetical protein